MENKKTDKSILSIVLIIVVLGLGATMLAKPKSEMPNASISVDGLKTSGSICETAWSENGTPNIPNFGIGEHVCGNPNAKVVIVEYSDFECPFCKVFHNTLEKIVAESDGKIAWVFRHYPIDQLHKKARNEALATECAYEQAGDIGFWTFANKIFEVTSSNDSLSPSLLPLIATDIGLDKEAFNSCLSSGKYLKKISDQEALGEDKGPIGTPNSRIFVGGVEVDELKGALDYETVKAKTDLWLKVE